LEAWFWKSF